MDKINCIVIKSAAQKGTGWVFDIRHPEDGDVGVWEGTKTDTAAFRAVKVGDWVELAKGSAPKKYFFNKVVPAPPADPTAPAAPAYAHAAPPVPADPVAQAEKAKELALLAVATWGAIASRTKGLDIPPTSEDITKLVTTILIAVAGRH